MNVRIVKTQSLGEGETLYMSEWTREGRPYMYSVWREDYNHILLGEPASTGDRAFAEILFKDRIV
ncbi:MAG: hypothetical protein ACXABY_34315 [Candidatus Thorarchaeota archaeon]|jgi:hypothetical protein